MVAAALLVSLAVGCSGSEPAADVPPSPSPSATPTGLPDRGGLVGAIDSARLVGFCENVRLAVTAAEGGLGADTVAGSLDAAFAVLRQPPQSAQLRTTTARWAAMRSRVGDEKAAARLQAFCQR